MDIDLSNLPQSCKDKLALLQIPHKVGRPSIYSQELADRICHEIALGKSIRAVCLDDDMPGLSSIFKWIRENKEFSQQYARATEERTEAQNEILLELGDDAIELSQTVDAKASGAVVQAVKLKADNLKWVMSKMKPKKYGDKVDVTSGGKTIQGNTVIFKNFTDEANSQ